MKLDAYQALATKEKIEILQLFWRTRDVPERLMPATLQYGYWAIVGFVVVAVELVVITALLFGHGSLIAWIGAACTVGAVLFIIQGVRRYRDLTSKGAT